MAKFLIRDDLPVRVGPAVAEELPGVSHLADLVHVEIGNDQLVLVTRTFSEDLSAGVAEIALSVKLAYVPWSLGPDAIDRPDEVAIRDGVSGLF